MLLVGFLGGISGLGSICFCLHLFNAQLLGVCVGGGFIFLLLACFPFTYGFWWVTSVSILCGGAAVSFPLICTSLIRYVMSFSDFWFLFGGRDLRVLYKPTWPTD